MKLRFRNNSLRLRLNRRETEVIAAGSTLKEQVSFPGGNAFAYSLEATTAVHPEASFQKGTLRVVAPSVELKRWAESTAIGIYFELPVNGSALKIAIEKDLECMDAPPDERDPDAFPRSACNNC
jgi:hypothetical protein